MQDKEVGELWVSIQIANDGAEHVKDIRTLIRKLVEERTMRLDANANYPGSTSWTKLRQIARQQFGIPKEGFNAG